MLVCKCWETSLEYPGCQNWVTQLSEDQFPLLLSQTEDTKGYSKGISSVKRNLLRFRLLLVIHKLIRDAWFFSGPYRMCRLDSSLFIALT